MTAIRPPLHSAERHCSLPTAESCKRDLTVRHAGSLLIAVNPVEVQGTGKQLDVLASTLVAHCAGASTVQFSAHQSYDSLLALFAADRHDAQQIPHIAPRRTLQQRTELLQQAFAEQQGAPVSASVINGVYIPAPGAVLPQGLLHAAEATRQHAGEASAHIAAVSHEALVEIDLEHARSGEAYILTASRQQDTLQWSKIV